MENFKNNKESGYSVVNEEKNKAKNELAKALNLPLDVNPEKLKKVAMDVAEDAYSDNADEVEKLLTNYLGAMDKWRRNKR